MRWLQTPNQELSKVLVALAVTLSVVTAVYCWPTNLLVDLAIPPTVFGLLILLRVRRR
jgi:hypothetical protein